MSFLLFNQNCHSNPFIQVEDAEINFVNGSYSISCIYWDFAGGFNVHNAYSYCTIYLLCTNIWTSLQRIFVIFLYFSVVVERSSFLLVKNHCLRYICSERCSINKHHCVPVRRLLYLYGDVSHFIWFRHFLSEVNRIKISCFLPLQNAQVRHIALNGLKIK